MGGQSFIVLALPRSRTFWLSEFLSYGDWHCGHDELMHMRSLQDVAAWFSQPCTGTVETAAVPFWRLLPPGVRIVTVRRPIQDALASVMRAAPEADPVAMMRLLWRLDRKLDQIETRIPGVLRMRFEDLTTEAACARVFERCLGMPHDPAWWASWSARNVTRSLRAQVRYAAAYLPQLEKLARVAKQRMLAGLARTVAPPEGFTFQDEPVETWYRDAVPLFESHMAMTGQDIGDWSKKNITLARQLDAAGVLQIITARSNGRMFGYAISAIGPSLDDPAAVVAQTLPIFADPACPGLGMKLQRHSIDALRARGVTEVLGRAGTRGSGPRLGTMFRRLGFEDAGQLYRLET